MQALVLTAFSLMTVPAYYAMFKSDVMLDAEGVEELDEETCVLV